RSLLSRQLEVALVLTVQGGFDHVAGNLGRHDAASCAIPRDLRATSAEETGLTDTATMGAAGFLSVGDTSGTGHSAAVGGETLNAVLALSVTLCPRPALRPSRRVKA